jgi:hypothetical protein
VRRAEGVKRVIQVVKFFNEKLPLQ